MYIYLNPMLRNKYSYVSKATKYLYSYRIPFEREHRIKKLHLFCIFNKRLCHLRKQQAETLKADKISVSTNTKLIGEHIAKLLTEIRYWNAR